MNPILLSQFNRLEVQRNELLTLFSAITTEQLNAHPEGKWSIAQIVSHLIASEQASIQYLNKKILGIQDAPDTGVVESIKMMILVASQRLPLKFKAPKSVTESTTTFTTYGQLDEAWRKTRQELTRLLEKFKDDQLQRKVYRHPVAGLLNVQQALRFFGEHIRHHTPQIKHRLRQK